METFNNYLIPVIVGICLVIGYIAKHWIKDVDNKVIPTALAVIGAVLAVVMNWGAVTLETVPEIALGGALSGLASTGLHQMFKQWLDNGGK